jgi:crotonobetainyl-CoA:carnitine CoA-transferase CaiB-like acyl-CoA transferase
VLHGVRVLDLTRILAGPWCTQLLADYGAQVIKIEKPGAGDDTRRWGPPFLSAANGEQVSAYFLSCNRGKRSAAIDFTQAQGAAAIAELSARSDIVVENYKPGTLAKYGLDYATLSARNARLIYCSISGFGQDGPNAQRAGYDAMIQAEAGLMSVTGEANGPAQKVGIAVSDLMCGMYAASGILAALHERERSGHGRHLDLALFDSQVAWLANQGMNYLVSGQIPTRSGNAHPNIVPYQSFASSDGEFLLAVGNDDQFRRFCTAAGCAALPSETRFSTNAKRVENRSQLLAILDPLLRQRRTSEWLMALEAVGVPCGPINNLDEVFSHSQTIARELSFHQTHGELGRLPQIANPLRVDGGSQRAELPPPRLGEHTDAVLEELGLDATQREHLREQGVIGG